MALPGISFEIVRTAGPVLGVRTDRGGLLALTERGPEEQPTLVHGAAEFHEVFGGTLDGTLGAIAADAFFKNGGQELVVGRFVPCEAKAARGELPFVPATGLVPALKLLVSQGGAFGNRVNVDSTIYVRRRLRGACTVLPSPTTLSFTGLTKSTTLFSFSTMCTGMRIVRALSAIARVTAWRIHHVAYVENL